MRLPPLAGAARRLVAMPPRQALATARDWGRRWAADTTAEAQHRLRPSFLPDRRGRLASLFPTPPIGLLAPAADGLAATSRAYLDHRFDLLGSGWVQVRHGMVAQGRGGHRYPPGPPVEADPAGAWLAGRVNRSNLARARRIWTLVDAGYRPIDWHLDFISGFRWAEATWYTAVTYGHLPGVDVKVPWELARSQHLPQVALAHALAAAGDDRMPPADSLLREFRNQVLDFMATNPPWWGVNWRCTMDVAIRVANWSVAYDLFRAQGATFDAAFEARLHASVDEHARFIVANLEWGPGLRSNHYLADIAGLLFAAAYLPASPDSDAWLAFAVHELGVEIPLQFAPDGANFEGSVCYHRLSAEMAAYSTALVLGLPPERVKRLRRVDPAALDVAPPFSVAPAFEGSSPFPATYRSRIARMADFTMAATKPDGLVTQIGDNDSGRFLKLLPSLEPMPVAEATHLFANLAGFDELPATATYWVENHLDHRHVVAAINGLLDRPDLARFTGEDWAYETALVGALAGGPWATDMSPTPYAGVMPVDDPSTSAITADRLLGDGTHTQVRWRVLPGGNESLGVGVSCTRFDDFGLFVFRSPRLYLAVRCGPVGQGGNGGHAHNDQLSIELSIDGRTWFADPGTYVYTPLPTQRNRYRSVAAHFAPRVGALEPGPLDLGLFTLPEQAHARCLAFGPNAFVGVHQGFGPTVMREVRVHDDSIEVVDTVPVPAGTKGPKPTVEHTLRTPEELHATLADVPPFSPGYGVLLAR